MQYDFISYPFGIYSSTIIGIVIPQGTLIEQFGWAVVINLFYIPGCVIGAFVVDRVGPKRLMVIMLLCQAVVGFGMSGAYVSLTNHVAGFAVVYGIFLSLGEAGPGTFTFFCSFPLPCRSELIESTQGTASVFSRPSRGPLPSEGRPTARPLRLARLARSLERTLSPRLSMPSPLDRRRPVVPSGSAQA